MEQLETEQRDEVKVRKKKGGGGWEREEGRRDAKWEGEMTLGWNTIKILYHEKEKTTECERGNEDYRKAP